MIRVSLGCSALACASLVACGAPQTEDDGIPMTSMTFDGTSPRPAADASTGTGSDAGAASELNDDQQAQIKAILKRGGDQAKNCNAVTSSNVIGEGEVQVVFDGTAGKVVDVQVGSPFAGTGVEECVKQSWIGQIILPFEGKPLTVPYTVKLDSKAAPPDPTKKKK